MFAPRRKGAVVKTASLPAPVGGWNARDSLGEMGPTDAVSLTNWYPGTTNCMLRSGFANYTTGLGSQVETLFVYSGATASEMYGAAGTSIYNVGAGGAVGAAVDSGLSNARFRYINVAIPGGNFMISVNGADKARYYDGTSWTADGTTYTITGLNTQNAGNICLHKNRVWFTEKASLKAWYLATSAVQGAATSFDLSGIAYLGGVLVGMATWTIDAGTGVDDLAVFVTSKGQVIVYRGTDPSSATTWALAGVWDLGSPIGNKPFMKYAGDLLAITQDGVVPMSGALQSSRLNPRVALTDKIQFATSQAISSYGSTFGWELCYFPKENMLILNVPIAIGQQQQYVMNTINKSWCNFTGWNANCFAIFNDDLYFGGSGVVCKAWYGLDDNGSNITGNGLQAFNDFGSPSRQKQFRMMRPTLYTNGSPQLLGNINVNYDQSDPTASLSFAPTSYGSWDSGVWDTAVWGSDDGLSANWQGAAGVGYTGAPRLKVAAKGISVKWVDTGIVYEEGGVL